MEDIENLEENRDADLTLKSIEKELQDKAVIVLSNLLDIMHGKDHWRSKIKRTTNIFLKSIFSAFNSTSGDTINIRKAKEITRYIHTKDFSEESIKNNEQIRREVYKELSELNMGKSFNSWRMQRFYSIFHIEEDYSKHHSLSQAVDALNLVQKEFDSYMDEIKIVTEKEMSNIKDKSNMMIQSLIKERNKEDKHFKRKTSKKSFTEKISKERKTLECLNFKRLP